MATLVATFEEAEYGFVLDRGLGPDLAEHVVLDVGSPPGLSRSLLAARGADVIGVDHRIPFAEVSDASVDACFLSAVLHCHPDRRSLYRELRRVTRPDGQFLAVEPASLAALERMRSRGAIQEGPGTVLDPGAVAAELWQAGFTGACWWLLAHEPPGAGTSCVISAHR